MNSRNFKLTNKGCNAFGNNWFQYVLPNKKYMFLYLNRNGELISFELMNLSKISKTNVLYTQGRCIGKMTKMHTTRAHTVSKMHILLLPMNENLYLLLRPNMASRPKNHGIFSIVLIFRERWNEVSWRSKMLSAFIGN